MDDGSSYSLQVTGDYSLITIRCLSRYLESTLAIMASVLIQPLFSDLRVDGIKELMRHRQKMEIDDPTELMQATLARVFFGASGYGAARFGDEASLAEISKKDIQAFFRSHFVAGNMVAVVISDGDEAVIKPLLARQLGRLPAGQKPSPQPVAVRKEERPALAVKRQSSQTHVSCSALLPGLTVENYLLATLLETWLGKGIGCRLWPLRSHSDLTYGLNADVLPYQEAMLLSVYLKTGQRRASEAQSELNKLLKAVYDNGISADEIAATRAFARAIFWRENETREQRAATLAFMEGMGLSYRLAGDFAERLETIDRDQLNRFIRAWLAPESWLSLQIGPE
jgi:predicted Zn-dependent peptidase